MKKIGALEAGGTKMVAAIIKEDGEILERVSIPTEAPEKTMPELIRFFKEREVDALGIGSFGPVDLKKGSPTYGYIKNTPKPGWKDYNILGAFQEGLGVPVYIDTDVNVAALGEYYYGDYAKDEPEVLLYITIGTGIGIGVVVNGQPLHGAMGLEGGHITIRPRAGETFHGSCPYHEFCFEGMASGPALQKKYGVPSRQLADRDDVWEAESDYIAQALANYIYILCPGKIILGGGVMKQEQLLPLAQKKTLEVLNGYLSLEELNDVENYIVLDSLHDNQGVLGCLALCTKLA